MTDGWGNLEVHSSIISCNFRYDSRKSRTCEQQSWPGGFGVQPKFLKNGANFFDFVFDIIDYIAKIRRHRYNTIESLVPVVLSMTFHRFPSWKLPGAIRDITAPGYTGSGKCWCQYWTPGMFVSNSSSLVLRQPGALEMWHYWSFH